MQQGQSRCHGSHRRYRHPGGTFCTACTSSNRRTRGLFFVQVRRFRRCSLPQSIRGTHFLRDGDRSSIGTYSLPPGVFRAGRESIGTSIANSQSRPPFFRGVVKNLLTQGLAEQEGKLSIGIWLVKDVLNNARLEQAGNAFPVQIID